jgi:predicted ATP-dependent protease
VTSDDRRARLKVCSGAHCPAVPLTSVTLRGRGAHGILGRMSDLAMKATRKLVTAQNMEEAKAAAYANDPQTELVILGLSENAAVTTCGWARHFFDSGGLIGF